MRQRQQPRYIDADLLRRLGPLEFEVQDVVEGFLSGMHRSPWLGFSIEFAQHRPYVPGDDIRHIDWKVYGRTERYILKQYHEETNFVATLLLDCSGSMGYGGNNGSRRDAAAGSKIEYASRLAVALAYLVLRQHDAVSVGVFDREVGEYLPARTHLHFLEHFALALEAARAREAADFPAVMADMAERITGRGVVILVSDLLDDPEAVREGLQVLRQQQHEVLLFQVLHREELEFPFEGNVRFEGLEVADNLRADASRLRDAYLEEFEIHQRAIRQVCARLGVDYMPAPTDRPLEEFLLHYLAVRRRRLGGRA